MVKQLHLRNKSFYPLDGVREYAIKLYTALKERAAKRFSEPPLSCRSFSPVYFGFGVRRWT